MLTLTARSQTPVYFPHCDHNWVIVYGTNYYGFAQYTWDKTHLPAGETHRTYTAVCIASRNFMIRAPLWIIVIVLVFALALLMWLTATVIGSLGKKDEEPSPPDPKPPP